MSVLYKVKVHVLFSKKQYCITFETGWLETCMMARNGRMWSSLVVRLKSIAAVSLSKLQSLDGL